MTLGNISIEDASDEQSDGPKRGIGRFLMEYLLAPARSSGALAGNDPVLEFLRCQFQGLNGIRREKTGVGQFVYFEFPNHVDPLPHRDTFAIGDVHAEPIDGSWTCLFALFVTNGILACLESVMVEGEWRVDFGDAIVKYQSGATRDLNELRNTPKWPRFDKK